MEQVYGRFDFVPTERLLQCYYLQKTNPSVLSTLCALLMRRSTNLVNPLSETTAKAEQEWTVDRLRETLAKRFLIDLFKLARKMNEKGVVKMTLAKVEQGGRSHFDTSVMTRLWKNFELGQNHYFTGWLQDFCQQFVDWLSCQPDKQVKYAWGSLKIQDGQVYLLPR